MNSMKLERAMRKAVEVGIFNRKVGLTIYAKNWDRLNEVLNATCLPNNYQDKRELEEGQVGPR